MKSDYYEYLQTLSKEQLIDLLYEPKLPKDPIPFQSYRTVALRISYEGKNFKGVQNHRTIKSIGGTLENALKLIGIGDSPVFCGRTDAEVSAINMIVTLNVKSKIANPNRSFQLTDSDHKEYPYDMMINERLPPEIRITGWAPAPDDFSARYSCIQRKYRYFFILEDINLDLMKAGAEKIFEMTDFYSLSTHSNTKAIYTRILDELTVSKVDEKENQMDIKEENIIFTFKRDTKKPVDKRNNENKEDIHKSQRESCDEVLINNIRQSDASEILNSKTDTFNENNQDNLEKQKGSKKVTHVKNKKKLASKTSTLECSRDLYCLDIKAYAFLHNMVRKIFWVLKSCGKGNEFNLKNVEISDGYPLVFVGAEFPEKLNFLSNRFSSNHFMKREEESRILQAISNLRLNAFDK
jgi:tRNA pseudouridine38/39 synthase